MADDVLTETYGRPWHKRPAEMRNVSRPQDPFAPNEQQVGRAARSAGENVRSGNYGPAVLDALEWLATAAPALPGLRPRTKRPSVDVRERTAYDTHEATPYAASGQMEGLSKLPRSIQEGYANDPRSSWAKAPGDRDVIYRDAGIPTLPTLKAQGFYEGPKGPEYNPVQVARPVVGREPTPDVQAAMDAAAALRGYLGVQGGSPWSKPVFGASDPDALFARYDRPMSRDALRGANTEAGKHNMIAIDTGEGMLAFNPMGERPNLAAARADFPKAEPVRKAGNYIDLSEELSAPNAGKGMATDKFLDVFGRAPTEVQQRLSQSPAISEVARSMAARDAEYAKVFGLGARPDVANMREAMSQPGWAQRLRDMRKAGIALPGVALMLGDHYGDSEQPLE